MKSTSKEVIDELCKILNATPKKINIKIMTPKEKAKELVDKFYQFFPLNKDVNTTDGELSWEYNDWGQAIQCALIAVDEILKELTQEISPSIHGFRHNYWKEVKRRN